MAKQKYSAKKPKEIPTGLARALIERKAGVDSEALLNDLIEVWGGPRQLAIDVHQEFTKAPSGGMTRQRILEMMQRLILVNTTHDIGRVIKPADMSTEDLEKLALYYAAKVTGNEPPAPAG